jgi:membrane protease YdiL (CAAX protease family)
VISLFTDPGTPRWLVVYLVFVAVTVAPLVEEMLFRGVALPILERDFGTRAAVLLVSAVFAAIHFHLPSMAPLLVIAAGFAVAYVRTGSLLVSITMHALFNGVNILMLFVLRDVPNLPLGQ